MKQFKVGDRISHTWSFTSQCVGSPTTDPVLKVAELRHERGKIISILDGVALFKMDDGTFSTAPLCNLRRLIRKPRREWWIHTNCKCSCSYEHGLTCAQVESKRCVRVREVKAKGA